MARPTQQDLRVNSGRKLYVALELSAKTWRLGMSNGGTTVRQVTVTAGDLEGLKVAVRKAKERFGLPATMRVPVASCYEAGRDGFWIHRALTEMGFDNVVVDPSSIEVDRRQRRAKTDRLDASKLVQQLIRHEERGDRLRTVRVPSLADEDARRCSRELERLKKERTGHVTRIRALLALHGIKTKVTARFTKLVGILQTASGTALPEHLRAEIERESERLDLVKEHVRTLEKARDAEVEAKASKAAQMAGQLLSLRGLGMVVSTVCAYELFAWRKYKNRREVGASVGLTGTPFASGTVNREQGISKAGNRHVRAVLIEAAWAWLRYQPESALALWYADRFGSNGARQRRVGIVAVARRLLIALWRYVDQGIIPEGALMKAELPAMG